MNRFRFLLGLAFLLIGCSKEEQPEFCNLPDEIVIPVIAADLSSYPEISEFGYVYRDTNSQPVELMDYLAEKGLNTVRLRLWHTPANAHSNLNEVAQFADELHNKGLAVWLTVHYSDSWADPGKQVMPSAWIGLSNEALLDSVYSYTRTVCHRIAPEIIQIGNEVNTGFLHPEGEYPSDKEFFIRLLDTAARAVRTNSPESKIMVHYAGHSGSALFFNDITTLDYDYIGLSYYPIWHGRSLTNLKSAVENLRESFDKNVFIAETAYPFTLSWNDYTHNNVGLDEHLILPDYPATPTGQADFIHALNTLSDDIEGICYWGGELTARKGDTSTTGSSWENQAFFDFDGKALPVIDALTGSR